MARGGDGEWQPWAEAWSGPGALTAQLWGIVSTRRDSIPGGGGADGRVPGLWLRGQGWGLMTHRLTLGLREGWASHEGGAAPAGCHPGSYLPGISADALGGEGLCTRGTHAQPRTRPICRHTAAHTDARVPAGALGLPL